jgi:hypothetical protein
LLPGKALLNGINMFNFRYEDGFKINNKYFPAISRILYLSTETISRPPLSHETIPLNNGNTNVKILGFSLLIHEKLTSPRRVKSFKTLK